MTAFRGAVVRLGETPDGGSVGEWRAPSEPMGVVVLLHDRGADLDSMRPFGGKIRALGLATLLVDLPGHGLSPGEWDADGVAAVAGALELCRSIASPVAVVAEGEAGRLVLDQPAKHVASLAIVGPRLGRIGLTSDHLWRRVPLMTVVDPNDRDAVAAQTALAGWTRAWYVRMQAHYSSGPSPRDGAWLPQLTTAAAAFTAEQIAYARAGGGATARRPRANMERRTG